MTVKTQRSDPPVIALLRPWAFALGSIQLIEVPLPGFVTSLVVQ